MSAAPFKSADWFFADVHAPRLLSVPHPVFELTLKLGFAALISAG